MAKLVKRKKFPHQIPLKSVEGISIEAFGDMPSNWDEFEALYKPVEDWIKENCNGEFSMFIIDDGWHTDPIYIGYNFYFEFESDAMAFKIKWAT